MIVPRDRPSSQSTRIESSWIPKVIIAPEAAHKMMVATLHFQTEVAWFGLVDEVGPAEYRVAEVLFPEQEAAGHTVEVQADHVAEFSMQLLEERGEDDYNRLRLWGHSHHSMGVSPSGQDNDTLKNLTRDSDTYFIAVRTNHDLLMEFDIGYKGGITFRSVPYRVEKVDVKDDPFIAELEAKVKPFKQPPVKAGYAYSQQGYYDHTTKQWVSYGKTGGKGKGGRGPSKAGATGPDTAGTTKTEPNYTLDPLPHYNIHPKLLTHTENVDREEFFANAADDLQLNINYCARIIEPNKWADTVGVLLSYGPQGESRLDDFINEAVGKGISDEKFITLLKDFAMKVKGELDEDDLFDMNDIVYG